MLYSVFVREYGSPHCVCVCAKKSVYLTKIWSVHNIVLFTANGRNFSISVAAE